MPLGRFRDHKDVVDDSNGTYNYKYYKNIGGTPRSELVDQSYDYNDGRHKQQSYLYVQSPDINYVEF